MNAPAVPLDRSRIPLDSFVSDWGVQRPEDGGYFGIKDVQYVDRHHVWTVVYDTETGCQVAKPDFSPLNVNALGFIKTEKPWTSFLMSGVVAGPYVSDGVYKAPEVGTIPQSDFKKHWGVERPEDGGLFQFEDIWNKPRHHVWAVLDVGEAGVMAVPGIHRACRTNRDRVPTRVSGYLLTKRPCFSIKVRAIVSGPEEHQKEAEPTDVQDHGLNLMI